MKERNYALDWLRCWCMFFIVLGHFCGNFPLGQGGLYFSIWGMGAVDLFILITGYFGIKKETAIRHFLNIYLEIIFYNLLMTVIFFIFTPNAVPVDFLKALLPLGPHKMGYWFATKYLGLLLVAPFLNIVLERLNLKAFAVFWCVLVFLNTTLAAGFPPGNLYGGPWTLMWFICLYVTGNGFRRLHEYNLVSRRKIFWLGVALPGYIAAFLIFRQNWHFLDISYNSLITFYTACCVFGFVMNCNIKTGILISWIAPCVFAVYLIHSQYFFHSCLQKVIAKYFLVGLKTPITAWLLMTLSVFIGCVFIDRIRLLLFQILHITQGVEWLSAKCTKKIEDWIHS